MKQKEKLLIVIILFFSILSCSGSDTEKYIPPTTVDPPGAEERLDYHVKSKELFDTVILLYGIKEGPTKGLFNENYPKKSGDNPASYLWPYDGLVSGVALLSRLGYDVDYEDFVKNFELYFRDSSESSFVGGYGSATNGEVGSGTRFYDDNSIVGFNLIEAYKQTKNIEYLQRASRIVKFLLSGEDDVLGGGLWWNESEKNIPGNDNSNKPTCSNGYATLFLLEYYTVCPEDEKAEVLAFALRLYEWVYNNLRDSADGCYWNDVRATGERHKTKWTYNTGVMISNGIRLYKISGNQSYLDSAVESAQGAYDYFVRPSGSLPLAYPSHDPWFTTKLIRSFIELEPYYRGANNYINTFKLFMDHAYKNARFSNGLFYEDWTGGSPKRSEQLLMQVAALESLGVLAVYENEKNK